MRIRNTEFEVGKHTYIMGILNVTPDSFTDGGLWNKLDAALKHAEDMIDEGASIIDIGGESTRPGYGSILPDNEELERVLPVIEGIRARFDIPISIDTYKSGVAEEAVKAGADLVNDIWGCKYDNKIADVIAKYNVPCCLMHNRQQPVYENYLAEVKSDLEECVRIAKAAGVKDEQIILDPGFGFGKTYEHNLILMKHLDLMDELGYPVLLGTSRKSMIGLTLNLPTDQRVEGTIATTVMGTMRKNLFIRVHDVKENYRAVKMTEAIMNAD